MRALVVRLPKAESLVEGPAQRLDFLSERLPVALRAAASKKAVQLANVGLNAGLLRRGMTSERQRLDALGARLAPALIRKRDQAKTDVARLKVPVPDVARAAERFETLTRRMSERAGRDLEARRALKSNLPMGVWL